MVGLLTPIVGPLRAGTISHVSLANSQDNSAKSDVEERENRRERVMVDAFVDQLVTSSKAACEGCMCGPVLLANESIDGGR